MRGIRQIGLALAAAAVLCLGAATALAGTGSTVSKSTSISGNGPASRSATCPVGTRATGGGFAITGAYNPTATTGSKTMVQSLFPTATRTFRATAAMQVANQPTTTLKTYVRCIKSTRGPLGSGFGEVTLQPGHFINADAVCPPDLRAISGGFKVDPVYTPAPGGAIPIVLRSRRAGPRTWRTTVINFASATEAVNLRYYALCERAGNGITKTRKRSVTLPPNARRDVGVKCPRKWHTASGGFELSPISEADILYALVDRSKPGGSRSWHAGAWSLGGTVEGEGGTLTVYAYCKHN